MIRCPHCQNDDMRSIERILSSTKLKYLCNVCSKIFEVTDDIKGKDDTDNSKDTSTKVSRPRRR
jgi:transposase-like protein